MKTNVTLRVDKNLLEKYKDRINFSKFFEFCLRTIEGEEFYIDLKTGKEVYKENDLNPSVSAPNHSPQELPTALKASSPSSVGVIGNEDTSKSKGCGKMYCAECGEIDKLHSAYCIEHGRSTHKICGDGGYCKGEK